MFERCWSQLLVALVFLLTPVAAPIVLSPLDEGVKPVFGRISQGQDCYARYRALLRRTLDEPFAVLLGL